jgi:hypothetical protein
MKKGIIFLFFSILFVGRSNAQTGIGTPTPHASAKLEIASTEKGFLPPRMTSAQRTSIQNPATGLMVYQTDGSAGLYYYGGSGWIYIINSTTNVVSRVTGTWTVPPGASTQSFTLDAGGTYSMWVNGNIPNGIIIWNATVTTANTNVPVVGSQYGWYYVDGNALVLNSMPDQIKGTNNTIITSPSSYGPNASNVFRFGITNNSGINQVINWGYIKL